MRIAQEEIFGPVICLIPYKSLDEAIEIANDTVHGLSSMISCADIARGQEVAKNKSRTSNTNHVATISTLVASKMSGNAENTGLSDREYLEVQMPITV